MCQSVLPLVSCLICLRVQESLYARLVLVVVVWFILEREVVLVAMCLLQSITSIFRKHTLRRSFRAIETVEKAVDQLTKLVNPRKEH